MPTFGGIGFGGGGVRAAVFNEGSSTGVSFSTLTNPDGDGKNYRLASFVTVGTWNLQISSDGFVEALMVGGGGGGALQGLTGNGYVSYQQKLFLPLGANSIVVGAGGTANPTGGSPAYNNGNHGQASSILSIITAGGPGDAFDRGAAPPSNPAAGSYSITGSSITYPNSTYGNGGTANPGQNGKQGVIYIRTEI